MAKATIKDTEPNFRPTTLELTADETEYLYNLLGNHILCDGKERGLNDNIYRSLYDAYKNKEVKIYSIYLETAPNKDFIVLKGEDE